MDCPELVNALLYAYYHQETLAMLDYADKVRDLEKAYQIQHAFTAGKASPLGGYKVSLTNSLTQKLFSVDEPIYGQHELSHLLPQPAELSLAKMNQPLIEMELGFIAKTDLYVGMTDAELLKNVLVTGCLEIPDSRFSHWFPALNKYLIVADGTIGGYVVYGECVDGEDLSVDELNNIEAELILNGQTIVTGNARAVLDNPLHALQWLLQKLDQHGLVLHAGELVSSGAFFLTHKLIEGQYSAHFSGALNQSLYLTVLP